MATLSLSLSPISLSRTNPNKSRTFRKQKPKNLPQNPNRKLNIIPTTTTSVSGGEATTYTRLPPKDDFAPSFSSSSAVVKLSDLKTPPQNPKTLKTEEFNSFNHVEPRFELYEVKSDNEDETSEIDNEDEVNEAIEKEKGVPAVMRCFDRAKIYVRAGDGGNGVMAFRREKFVPFGGPSGGDGGKGGNVYLEVDKSMTSLLPFRQSVHFRAGRGSHGQGSKMNGAKGEDVVVKVPGGTVVREAGASGGKGEVLLELLRDGERAMVLAGGRGGRGNASFKSGSNKVPKIAENGEEGAEM